MNALKVDVACVGKLWLCVSKARHADDQAIMTSILAGPPGYRAPSSINY